MGEVVRVPGVAFVAEGTVEGLEACSRGVRLKNESQYEGCVEIWGRE